MHLKTKLFWFANGAVVAAAFLACSDSGTADNGAGRTILARNVLLGTKLPTASVKTANAESTRIDTTTQMPASNVVFEQSATADLSSTNVQGALEELSVKLDAVLPGRWNIQNLNQENLHAATGKIEFKADGSFDLKEGSFAAIGMGSNPEFCNHESVGQTFQLFTPRVALFAHTNGTASNTVIPTLIEAKPDRLVFIGSGGCGVVGQQRISILTRAQ
jgi:hypothetical protein